MDKRVRLQGWGAGSVDDQRRQVEHGRLAAWRAQHQRQGRRRTRPPSTCCRGRRWASIRPTTSRCCSAPKKARASWSLAQGARQLGQPEQLPACGNRHGAAHRRLDGHRRRRRRRHPRQRLRLRPGGLQQPRRRQLRHLRRRHPRRPHRADRRRRRLHRRRQPQPEDPPQLDGAERRRPRRAAAAASRWAPAPTATPSPTTTSAATSRWPTAAAEPPRLSPAAGSTNRRRTGSPATSSSSTRPSTRPPTRWAAACPSPARSRWPAAPPPAPATSMVDANLFQGNQAGAGAGGGVSIARTAARPTTSVSPTT